MIKTKLLAISFLSIFSMAFSSLVEGVVFYDIDTTSPLLCTFSSKYQNRIMIENGTVKKVIAPDEDRLSIYMEELSGQAFIFARDDNPEGTTLSVITQNGVVQDLQVTFIERSSEVVILKDPDLEQVEESVEDRVQNSSTEDRLMGVVREILSGYIPDGYFPSPMEQKHWHPKSGITLKPLAQLEGSDEVLFLYEVINTTTKKRSLLESELQCKNCRWVFLEKNTLLHKEKMFGIVAVQKYDR